MRKWEAREDEMLDNMRGRGETYRVIAAALCRSRGSVKDRVQSRGLSKSKAPPIPFVPPPRVAIPHADVPTYYELGWRFDGFAGGMCVFVWPGSCEPRRPVKAVREMEAA